MTPLRATTNLVIPEHLQLPKQGQKARFMFVYRGLYAGMEPVFMNRLWLSVFFPEIANDPSFGKDRKNVRQYISHVEKLQKAGLLKLKKVNDAENPHFVVSVPLAEFSRYDVGDYMRKLVTWFTNGKGQPIDETVDALSEELRRQEEAGEKIQQRDVPTNIVLQKLNEVDGKTKAELKECLLGLRLQYSGGLAVVYADFKITKEEAQQLTTTEWMLIRNSDLYPLLLQWQVSMWGMRGNAPVTSFPMSRISKTLPPVRHGQTRVNEYGLSISPAGIPMWLPEKLDNTTRYEDLYAQVGDKGDDSFSLVDLFEAGEAVMNGTDLKVQLPANIPVLIDWVNNRFAYTQGSGTLKIQDLSRFLAADASHARNILTHWTLEKEQALTMVHMGVEAGVPDSLTFTEEEAKEISSQDPAVADLLMVNGGIPIKEYWDLARAYHRRFVSENDFKLLDVSIEGATIWRPLARHIEIVQGAVIQNMDAVNQKFSVSGTSTRLGLMTVIAKYGNDMTNTTMRANNIAAAALNQGVDPNWTPPSIPLIMNNPERPFSLIPHQVKVRNILKDSPDFALLPVQAGGGKTPLAITDVLYELKANRSGPYLIMCPAPLVAQYVKEITYFTDGKVNVIPIASETLAKHGFERVTQMIQTAPRNTIVVVNYDVLRQRAYDVCYGTTNVTIYPVIELLRQFGFGYALLDESHFMKNDSQRTRAAMVLISDIPKKRLASGTMAHDSPSDLALQVALLDPSLFGSREAFNNRFGEVVEGDRVIEWKPGAQPQIMAMIQSRIVVAKAMRKEWAALLPKAEEYMHRVDLSDAQRSVYQAILTEALDKIREDAKSNPALRRFVEHQPAMLEKPQAGGDWGRDEDADELAEDVADESAGDELEGLLGFYLARLEQFLTAPGADPLGARLLHGDDLLSPKVTKILEIVKNHITSGLPGKILIFTNYVESAEAIYNAADDALKASGILYTAGGKVEDGAQFESNPNKRWMVGVQNSMNTGLNFQYVSALILVENVWNPGTLEQGNARINRPEMKKADERPSIFYHWVIANNSVDVTKLSRLISKIIAVAKFENTDNHEYEELPNVPVIPMTADAIELRNSWEDLATYADAYRQYNQVKARDYEEYRRRHGELTMYPLHEAPTPRDAAIMAEVPYVAGIDLYKGSESGLIRVDEFLRLNANDMEAADDVDVEDAEGQVVDAEQQRKREMAASLIGQAIHTEFGDGACKSVAFSSKMLTVALNSGYTAKLRFASTWVITKQGGPSIRSQIVKGISQHMPVIESTGMIGKRLRVDNQAMRRMAKEEEAIKKAEEKAVKERELLAQLNIELQFNVSNGFLGIVYYPEKGADASAALQALGFRPVEPYVYAEVKTAKQLVAQFNMWKDAGFTIEERFRQTGTSQGFTDLAKVLQGGQLHSGVMNYKFANRNHLQNFFKMEIRPSASRTEFKPYPMIEDGRAFIVMHMRGQPATIDAMKVKAPAIRWHKSAPCYAYYGLDTQHIRDKMREIVAAGLQVANIEDLKADFVKLRKQKFRNSETAE